VWTIFIWNDRSVHVFVDESIRNDTYLLCAVWLRPNDLLRARSTMRSLCHHGQRRVHMVKERASSRREILTRVTGLPFIARIYHCDGHPVAARARCLETLLDDLRGQQPPVTRLAIESMEGQDQRDREVIFGSRYRHAELDALSYEHLKGHEEPLLAVADVVAWAYGARGDWRRRVECVVEKVVPVGD
jgi:hypothetical protein